MAQIAGAWGVLGAMLRGSLALSSLKECRWLWAWPAPMLLGLVFITNKAMASPSLPAVDRVVRLCPQCHEVAAWPAIRMLEDVSGNLDAAAARSALDRFEVPRSPYQNLGQRVSTVWLHVPVQVEAGGAGNWVAYLEYPLLNQVELVVFDHAGQTIHHSHNGSMVPFPDRPLPTRALAAELRLQQGQTYDVLLRIRTVSAVVVPLRFMSWPRVSALEGSSQIFFGVSGGLMLFMLAYSLSRWISLRQHVFLAYAGVLCANAAFVLAVYGVGAQYLWPHSAWFASQVPAGAGLAGVAANLYFCLYALDVPSTRPRLATVARVTAVAVLVILAGFLLGLVDYRAAAAAASIGSVFHVALFLPLTVLLLRRNNRAAAFLVVGWLSFAVGILTITSLLRGLLPANTWTLYAVQIGAIGEMLCWMMVLGLRVEDLRESAERSRREHDVLDALAHTDPLTGLTNRRGLERALAGYAGQRRIDGTSRLLALYVLDLDGFKQINDELGHGAGDLVLTTMAQRLRAATRNDDVVVRSGGDEFIVLVAGILAPAEAELIGHKLLAVFEPPIDLPGRASRWVGGTVGYSLRMLPLRDAPALMREADAAMYAGKVAGKHQLVAYTEKGRTSLELCGL